MDSKSLKQKFGAMMREQILNAHLRQADVASLLKISNSAVSQIISGKIVLSQPQLEKFAEKAALSRSAYLELASLLSRIRAGYSHLRSPFNQLLFALRCQNAISRPWLAEKCKIKTTRLKALESDFQAVPTEEEINILSEALNTPAEDLRRSLRLTEDEVLMSSPSAVSSEVRESSATYSTSSGEPELCLRDMMNFSAELNILDFAKKTSSKFYCNPPALPVPTAAIVCRGTELSLLWDGKVIIHLSPERPDTFFQVEFCRMVDGSYRLRELKGRTWRDFAARSRRKANEKAIWAIPVLEFSFLPEK